MNGPTILWGWAGSSRRTSKSPMSLRWGLSCVNGFVNGFVNGLVNGVVNGAQPRRQGVVAGRSHRGRWRRCMHRQGHGEFRAHAHLRAHVDLAAVARDDL